MKKVISFFIVIFLLATWINLAWVGNVFADWRIQSISAMQTIEDGIYEIEIKQDNGKVIDISAASKASKANVQIWERSNVLQQRFEIKFTNGYYTIKNINSGKVLDVDNASKVSGTNVQQYVSNATDAQKWQIKVTEDGYYNIISKCNELYLTVDNDTKKEEISLEEAEFGKIHVKPSTSNGININVTEGNELENQEFIFRKVEPIVGTKTISDGLYSISTALDESKVLDISAASMLSRANVQIWGNENMPQQKFYVKYDENGYYTMTNLHSGKLLDVANGDIGKGTNVQQYTSNSTDAQKWVIKETEDGYYNIISKSSGIYLDVSGGKTSNGTNVQINIHTGTDKQKFIFTQASGASPIIDEGKYEITTKMALNMLVDVSGGSSADGTNVQIWADANEKQQKFNFEHVGNGYYKIICERTGKALTVANNGTNYSSNVYQNTYTGSDNQLWSVEESGDILSTSNEKYNVGNRKYYYIISKYNNRNLDVASGSTSNGTNIRVYTQNNSNAQKFLLEQKKYGIDVSHWQSTINFKDLKDSGRIDFMIIRAGHGLRTFDTQFENNYANAKKYNIPVGVYLYASAQNVEEAKTEANHLVNLIKGKNFELPIYYDVEEQADVDKDVITQMCIEFYNIIKKAGYNPGIYASKYYLKYKMDPSRLPSDCSIWAAAYGKNDGTMPTDGYRYMGNHDIWQFTSRGSMEGISGDVDFDVIFNWGQVPIVNV